ncbi:hypothetical protein K523DRAFT_422317 [Schizophyllum commune Tattone D]|nr:hypothetical protein K523DRAFT_422317 [Schizophyllum commune Tattone D]
MARQQPSRLQAHVCRLRGRAYVGHVALTRSLWRPRRSRSEGVGRRAGGKVRWEG